MGLRLKPTDAERWAVSRQQMSQQTPRNTNAIHFVKKSLECDGKCMTLPRELTFMDVTRVVAVSDVP